MHAQLAEESELRRYGRCSATRRRNWMLSGILSAVRSELAETGTIFPPLPIQANTLASLGWLRAGWRCVRWSGALMVLRGSWLGLRVLPWLQNAHKKGNANGFRP